MDYTVGVIIDRRERGIGNRSSAARDDFTLNLQ